MFEIYKQSETETRINVPAGNTFKIVSTINGSLSGTFLVNSDGELLIRNVKTPTSTKDAANKEYVDSKNST